MLAAQASTVQEYQTAGYGEFTTVSEPDAINTVESVASGPSADVAHSTPTDGNATHSSAYDSKLPSGLTSTNASEETAVSESSHAVGYDSINGGVTQTASYVTSGVGENGSASNDTESAVMEQRFGGEAGTHSLKFSAMPSCFHLFVEIPCYFFH